MKIAIDFSIGVCYIGHKQALTPQFEKIASKYKLDLNGNWNKVSMPHAGRHPNDYHKYILRQMDNIDKVAQGNKSVFLTEFGKVQQTIINNPGMLTKNYWL